MLAGLAEDSWPHGVSNLRNSSLKYFRLKILTAVLLKVKPFDAGI